jgi:hydrophobe/amphiphile efflux-3 (HAE3) family protein
VVTRVYRFIAFNPKIILAGLAVLTLAALAGIIDVPGRTLRLKIETAIDKVLPHGSPDRVFYEDFQNRFGADNLIYLGMVLEDGDVFTTEHLERIKSLTRQIGEVDGVRRVISLSSAPDIRWEDGELLSGGIYDEVPEDEAGLLALRERVMSNPLHAGNLVSEDGQAVAFLVYPDEMSEPEFRSRRIDLEIERVGREGAPPGAKILLAGGPPIKAETSRTLQRDLLTFLPVGYLLMSLVGWLAFRSARGVLLSLSAISFGIVWTFSLMALSGRSLNLVTFIVPLLIQAVGFAYAVHVVAEHDDALREGEVGPTAVFHSLRRVAFPVLLTAATTAAGFASLTLSRIPAIREFGAFCTVGVVACTIASLTFVPAVQSLIRAPRVRPQPSQGGIERWAGRVASFDVRHRSGILATGAAVAAVAVFGLTRIEIGTSFVDNFMDDHPLRRAIETFDERLTGSMTIFLVLNSGEKNAFKDPVRLKQLRELQDWIESQPEVGSTTSLADFVMTVNQAFKRGDPAAFRVPDSRSLIAKYLFFFWSDNLESLVDSSFSGADIQIRGPNLNSYEAVQLLDRIDAKVASIPGLTGGTTGSLAVIARTMDEIAWGQAKSLSGATVIIFAILTVYFRSLRVAAWALVPNALPVLVYFGMLGLTGITLNVITSLIACIILGIAVDDTIHFLVRYRELAKISGDETEAAIAALRVVVRPVTTTTAALCGGFSVLMASGLRHQVEFGILATALLAFAWVVDVTLTPALASKLGLGRGGSAE